MDSILFDLDGTIADPFHRRHFVRIKPRNWPAFFKAQVNDTVIEPIATIARELYKEGKYKVIIFTARPDTYKEMTETWLKKHNINYHAIYMRKGDDNRDDSITKKEMYEKLLLDGYQPLAVFDDRPKVCRFWKSIGLLTFCCADQSEEF
jgi:phosphoglycolate phosphatase-like HAD superfamily hydrolase